MTQHEERCTTSQSQGVVAAIGCNVDWSEVSQQEAVRFVDDPMKGGLSTAFIKSGRQVFFGELIKLPISRSQPYDPATYPSDAWMILEQDERSLALSEVDPNEMMLMSSGYTPGEEVDGGKHLRWLKRQAEIRLDAQVLQMFWENKHRIPETWKEKVDGHAPFVFFDGTILSGGDSRISLYLHWTGREWERNSCHLSHIRASWMASAVLKV